MNNLILIGFAQAAGVFAYVGLVALFMFNAQKIFGKVDTIVAPILMLMLFVFSAAVTGLMVLGRPGYLYSQGQKKEGITLLVYTLGFILLFICGIIIYVGMSVQK
jgi:hypothetical protein